MEIVLNFYIKILYKNIIMELTTDEKLYENAFFHRGWNFCFRRFQRIPVRSLFSEIATAKDLYWEQHVYVTPD
jgi:hypothetical protein